MLPNEPYKRFAVITLYATVFLAVIYLIFNFLWGAILPFIIAYLFAECFKPVVKYSEKNKRFPKRFFVLFVVLIASGAVIMLIYALTKQIFTELGEFSSYAKETVNRIRTDENYAKETIEKISNFIPFVDLRERLWEMRTNLDEELWSIIISFGEKLSGNILSAIGSMATFVPNLVFSSIVTVISTYYFAIDRVKINCFFLSLFPKKIRPWLKRGKDILSQTAIKYLRAYGLLFLITFSELLTAFLIIDIKYSFLLALITALIDVLPVLGTGIILIPWSIVMILMGNYKIGIGLLITYAVITVVRQIIEPKIIGKFIGLSPICALASIYIGLKLMGIWGIIAFPIGAIILTRLIEYYQENPQTNTSK